MSGRVGIFRLHLFKLSETFIANQANSLRRYRPTYIGRKIVGPIPLNASVVAKDNASMVEIGRMVILRDPCWETDLLNSRLNLIHAHFGIDGVYAIPLARRLGIPLVTTLHGIDATRSTSSFLTSIRPAFLNYALLGRQLTKSSSLFICVSDFIRREAKKKGFPPDKLKVHYIGVDTDKLMARADAGDNGLIVHVGRLVEKKGTVYLIRSMVRIRAAYPNAQLIVIGDGPLRSRLAEEAEVLGLGSSVRFLGALPNAEALRWVRKAAVMVVPSVTAGNGDAEGLGMVNLEASGQGVPIVASLSGGIPEAIKDAETGFLVPERDVEALAERISLLLGDVDLRHKMGRAGREFVRTNFDIRKQSEKLEQLYDSVLAQK
jgi:glycosyltransferase involved in cell wall biosynthesis